MSNHAPSSGRALRSTVFALVTVAACSPQSTPPMYLLGNHTGPSGAPVDPLKPTFGPIVTLAQSPPPISGGTLLVTRDGATAVAADPDRDRVWLVDTARHTLRAQVALAAGDEPGRVVEDDAGRVHVALRRGGAVASIDVASGRVLFRRAVCAAPRGLAFDPGARVVYVACATGELVTLPADGGDATRTVHLDDDLRDVVVQGGTVYVSRFRSAELLTLAADGSVAHRVTPTALTSTGFEPDVAWRAIAMPSGHGVAVLHQRAHSAAISAAPGGYGASNGPGPCLAGVVHGTVSVFDASGAPPPAAAALTNTVLPVDVAVTSDQSRFAVAAAGNALTRSLAGVLVFDAARFTTSSDHGLGDPCAEGDDSVVRPAGQATAVAFTRSNGLVVQTREPAALYFEDDPGASVALGTDSRADSGHEVFHTNAGGLIACASCHPEGGDDGRVWQFESLGPRRTMALRGGILATAPFHWTGDQPDLTHLAHEVFVSRMGGDELTAPQVTALGHFLDAIPAAAHATTAAADAVERGHALFEDATVACASCHAGEHLTNNATVDVGTGGAFQVPSLYGLAWRPPYMHTGCAATLRDRFGPCGGGDQHGHTSQLSSTQIDDLVAYLGSL